MIKKKASEEQQHLIPKAEAFLRELQREEAHIMVPSVIIHEMLAPLPPGDHAAFMKALGEGFMVPPYDLAAAHWSAKVWNKNGAKHYGELQEAHPALPFARRTIKIDCLLVGVALAQKSDCIYSHDTKHVGKLAKDFITVRQMDGNLELDLNGP